MECSSNNLTQKAQMVFFIVMEFGVSPFWKKFSEKGPTDLGSTGQYPQISILNISLSEYGKNTCECSVVYLAGQ